MPWLLPHLPSSPLVGRASVLVLILLFLEQVGFPLQRQADALDAGGGEADDYPKLCARRISRLLCARWSATHSNAGARRQFHHGSLAVDVAALALLLYGVDMYCYLDGADMLWMRA